MEILTLLKANIRYKKGSFFSILLLMVIISMSLTAILSGMDNCRRSIKEAYGIADAGDISFFIADRRLTKKLKRSVENHPLVKRVEDCRSVAAAQAQIDGRKYENRPFLRKLHEHATLIDDDGSAYAGRAPSLKKGEIYVPKGFLTSLDGSVGDTLTIKTIGGEYSFTIKGVVLDPFFGAFVIGYKQLFVNDEDFEQMAAEARAAETVEETADMHELMVYKTDGCTLSSAQLRRKLNLDTDITDQGVGSLTKDMSIQYTSLFPEIIAAVLTVFIMLLVLIVLIMMGHSISAGIEMDYVNLGILKSFSFSQGRIRLVFILQYALAQVIGAALGMVLSVPLIHALRRVLWPITSVVTTGRMSAGTSLAALAAVIGVSILFIFLITGKVGKISPVRAIAGGRSEIYFDSRLKTPISQKALLPSLSLRQLISGRRRMAASVMAASILSFFLMSMTLLANALTSKSGIQAMGTPFGECGASFHEKASDAKLREIEETVTAHAAVETVYYWNMTYLSIDGEEILCTVYRDPEQFVLIKGRAPVYENELVITEILADTLGLAMGDEVVVGCQGRKEAYLISGIFQCMHDVGQCFGSSLAGVKRMGIDPVWEAVYSLKEPDMAGEVVEALNAAWGDILKAESYSNPITSGPYQTAIEAVRIIIYSFSVIFALIVVQMVCAKAFLQEKTDIGIYKAVGFTVRGLRLQFAFRFLFVAVTGSAGGAVLSVLLSGRMLNSLLRGMGVTSLSVTFTAVTVIVPAALICACFFVFAFWGAGRVKRVAVRELVAE